MIAYGLLSAGIYFLRHLASGGRGHASTAGHIMSWWLILSADIALILALLLLGVPIFVAFLMLNVTGMLLLLGPGGFGMITNSIYTTSTLGALAAVPLFILMGELLFRSGAMEVLFDSLDRLIGRIRGRQYVLCIVLSAIIGALSGAAMAVAGLLGRSLFPTMRKRGYDLHHVGRHDPRRRQPGSDHPAQRAGDHHCHAGRGIDGKNADRRCDSGFAAVGNVYRLRSRARVPRTRRWRPMSPRKSAIPLRAAARSWRSSGCCRPASSSSW